MIFQWLKKFRKERITHTKAIIQYERPWYLKALLLLGVFLTGLILATLFRVAFIEKALRTVSDPITAQKLEECQISLANKEEIDNKISDAQTETLTQQLSRLQAENTQLKSDLAVYEKLSSTPTKPGEAAIRELTISRLPSGEYQYQVLVAYSPTQRGMAEQEVFEGTLFLSADTANSGKTIVIAGEGGIVSTQIDLKIRYFRRLSGTFVLDNQQKITLFRARIRKNGRIIDTKTENIPPAFYEKQL